MTRKDIEALNAAAVGDVVAIEDGRLIKVDRADGLLCRNCMFNSHPTELCLCPAELMCMESSERLVRFVDITQPAPETRKSVRRNRYVRLKPGEVVVNINDVALFLSISSDLDEIEDAAYDRLAAAIKAARDKIKEEIKEPNRDIA